MLPLRYPWLWLVVGWALAVGVGIGSLLPGGALLDFSVHDKLLHAGSYFVLMIWFAGVYETRRHIPIALALMAAGLVLDALQSRIETRTFSAFDVLANSVGVLLGLALARLGLGGWCQRVERFLFA
jgi:hypothetical protein